MSDEDVELILNEIDPEWMERFGGDAQLAAEFYKLYNMQAWVKARRFIAGPRKDPKRVDE